MKKFFQIILTILAYLFLSTSILQLTLNIYFKFKSTDLIISTLFMTLITVLTFSAKILIEGHDKSKFKTNLNLGLMICFIIFFFNYLINPNKNNINFFLYSSLISLILILLISFNNIKKFLK